MLARFLLDDEDDDALRALPGSASLFRAFFTPKISETSPMVVGLTGLPEYSKGPQQSVSLHPSAFRPDLEYLMADTLPGSFSLLHSSILKTNKNIRGMKPLCSQRIFSKICTKLISCQSALPTFSAWSCPNLPP